MIKIIAVGKLKEKATDDLVKEYTKRIALYTKLEIIEVIDEKTIDKPSIKEAEMIKEKEAKRVLDRIKSDDFVIILDLHGDTLDSNAFANYLDKLFCDGKSNLVFAIGGSLGIGESLLKRANYRLKISDFTFPHQICRILLVEQIYRAYTIINNTPYHK